MNGKVIAAIVAGVLVLCICVAACGLIFVVTQNVGGLATRFLGENELVQAQATLRAIGTLTIPTVSSVPSGRTTPAASSSSASSKASSAASSSSASTKSASSAAGPAAGAWLEAAITKMSSVQKMRIQFSFILGSTENGKYTEQPFMDMTGEMDNGKAHLTSKGFLTAMFGGSDAAPVEIIEADGKTYMRGVTMFGMTDPKVWYVTDDSSTSGFSDFAKPDELDSWTAGTNPSDFKKARTENLDNQSCDIYVNDTKDVPGASFLGMLGGTQGSGDFSAVDKGQMSYWLCRDGYVHQFVLDYQGHNSSDATQKGALKIQWHAWDFGNNAISVTVPKDAKKMPGQ